MSKGFSETTRQLVHIAMGAFALLLRWLTWWQAALAALLALLFNLFLLPRLAGATLFRPTERVRTLPAGIVFYPCSVLVLILAFPSRPDIVAMAWGIMAVGDGFATLAGKAITSPPWPWNRDKTLAGSLAFVVTGSVAAIFLGWWTAHALSDPLSLSFLIGASILAAATAALVETMPIGLDDNLSVPAIAAVTLWLSSLVHGDAVIAGLDIVRANLPDALVANLVVAVAGRRARTVSRSGALGGFVIGVLIYACLGLAGWLLLLAAFVIASLTSRVGLRRKTILGIAEERKGERGVGNAIANCGVAVVAGILAVTTPYHDLAVLAAVTALATGGSDTVASELGKAWGQHTFLIIGFRRVAPGTSGGISLEGTLGGLIAAFVLTAVAFLGGLIPAGLMGVAVLSATIGSFVESALGATLEGPGILNHDALNFLNTAVAACVAVLIAARILT